MSSGCSWARSARSSAFLAALARTSIDWLIAARVAGGSIISASTRDERSAIISRRTSLGAPVSMMSS